MTLSECRVNVEKWDHGGVVVGSKRNRRLGDFGRNLGCTLLADRCKVHNAMGSIQLST